MAKAQLAIIIQPQAQPRQRGVNLISAYLRAANGLVLWRGNGKDLEELKLNLTTYDPNKARKLNELYPDGYDIEFINERELK
jgi:hypothetical protein